MILLLNQIFCGLNGSCGRFRSGVYMRFGVDAGRYSLSGDKAADHRLQVNAKAVEQSCGSLGSGFGDVFDSFAVLPSPYIVILSTFSSGFAIA